MSKTATAEQTRRTARRPKPVVTATGAKRPRSESPTPFSPRYQRAIELIGQRWTGAIIDSLLSGNVRFSDIRASVPDLSDRLLWERLKALETAGLVERLVVNRRHTAYRLTPKGEALKPVVRAIHGWADEWLATGTDS